MLSKYRVSGELSVTERTSEVLIGGCGQEPSDHGKGPHTLNAPIYLCPMVSAMICLWTRHGDCFVRPLPSMCSRSQLLSGPSSLI